MRSPKVAIVGGESLLGRELRDLLSETSLSPDVQLLSDEAESGILSERDEEPVYISPLEDQALKTASVAFLAGSSASSVRALNLVSSLDPAPVLIDAGGTLEIRERARLRAPAVEPDDFVAPPGTVHVIAHPAAIALALFYARLGKRFTIQRSVAQVFEPASERGRRGVEELQRQTVSLLSFKKMPQAVFDAQLGFNLLPRYGREAPLGLAEVEARIRRHLAALVALAGNASLPSLRLAQAPVFHGYSFSIWVEFESNPGAQALGEALASTQIDIRSDEHEPPTNVGVAGQSGVTVGAIEADRGHPRACWFWMVADNLRLSAENAIQAAWPLMGGE